ncbi:MAG: pirin family protein [Bacteroidetes bacterium]|nr:pirin family protein [Bacteroidota bacterium]
MKTVYHSAQSRGFADHDWLKSYHSFSFANYHEQERMHFGVLRVLNDDAVAPGKGFGRHPHSNMEIISIPLQGALVHQDSMGNKSIIRQGDIQVMSAGTGVEHSEFNNSNSEQVRFLQIWVIPRAKGVAPRYDQQQIPEAPNTLVQVLSPSPEDQGVWIHQNAWFSIGTFDQDVSLTYTLHDQGNGLYAFVLDGQVKLGGHALNRRDGLGIWETESVQLEVHAGAQVLLMEVPMQLA